MRIEKEDTTALIIDIQERLMPAMGRRKKMIRNCRILIAGLHELGIPIAVTQQYTKGLGETIPEIAEQIKDINPIEKTDFSCYGEAGYSSWLKDIGKRSVVICGIEAHVCVLQTAIDLKQAGYNPVIVANCISSRKKEDKKLALERLRHENILITSYESILFELTRSAKASGFKAVSKLVK